MPTTQYSSANLEKTLCATYGSFGSYSNGHRTLKSAETNRNCTIWDLTHKKLFCLATILGCNVGSLPFSYLGLPLHSKKFKKVDWTPVINRIDKRIEGWKAKLLSLGGRLTLVNSVLTNLPLHYFTVFKVPPWVIQSIEALRRAFFWKGCNKINREGLLS